MNRTMYFDVYKNSLDENNAKYVPDEVFETLEEASETVNEIIKNYHNDNGPLVYSVIRKTDLANLGYVQLCKIDNGWEIGYHIAKLFNGNNYATDSVKLFLSYLKNHTDIKEVFGISLFSNKASKRVLEKVGFKTVFEGDGYYQGKKRKIIKAIFKIKEKEYRK